jgi:branched-chain amino acid transport system substrate-binding protein
MKTRILKLMVIGLAIVGLITLGACQKQAEQKQVNVLPQGPIKIGFISPFTGEAAEYGNNLEKVVALAVNEINQAGGVNGQQIEIIYEDGRCNGEQAVTAAQKLINIDQVKLIIGGLCSSETLAMVPLAEQNQVFVLSPGSTSPDLENISQFFARDIPSDSNQGKVLAQIAYQDKAWRKVAALVEQQDYTLGIYKFFDQYFSGFGGETLKEEYKVGETDFRTALIKLKSANPDALLIANQTPSAVSRVLKQLKEIGWQPALFLTDSTISDAGVVKDNATQLGGAIGANYGVDPENPKFKQLAQNWQKTYGKELPIQSYSQTFYDAVYILTDAIKTVGDDTTKIATYVRNLKNWQGASGTVNLENGDPLAGFTAKVVEDGKAENYR